MNKYISTKFFIKNFSSEPNSMILLFPVRHSKFNLIYIIIIIIKP